MPTVVLVDAENVRRSRWPNLAPDELLERCRQWAIDQGVEVEVVFEPPAGTADDLIAERARALAAKGTPYWLVTSDRGLRALAAERAARVVGGGSFLKLLEGG